MNNKEEKNKKIIMVVEDEASLQLAIQTKLNLAGYGCISARSAEEAIELLKDSIPNLIWLDLLMPGMGGLAFLKKLRENEVWRNIPVIVVSVSASPEKVRAAFELNVMDYIVKSQYKLEDIIKKVDEFVRDKS